MARHVFTKEECSKGGKNQPREIKVIAGKRGFQTTMDRYPFMARHWLKYAPGMTRFGRREFNPESEVI